jgi:hypothetical protein
LLGLRRLLLLLATFFRGALGRRTLLLGCLREHALGRGWLVVVLLLRYRTLPLSGLLLLELLLGLLALTFLTVTAGFFLQSTLLGLALYT